MWLNTPLFIQNLRKQARFKSDSESFSECLSLQKGVVLSNHKARRALCIDPRKDASLLHRYRLLNHNSIVCQVCTRACLCECVLINLEQMCCICEFVHVCLYSIRVCVCVCHATILTPLSQTDSRSCQSPLESFLLLYQRCYHQILMRGSFTLTWIKAELIDHTAPSVPCAYVLPRKCHIGLFCRFFQSQLEKPKVNWDTEAKSLGWTRQRGLLHINHHDYDSPVF